jgi:hypothetical protein
VHEKSISPSILAAAKKALVYAILPAAGLSIGVMGILVFALRATGAGSGALVAVVGGTLAGTIIGALLSAELGFARTLLQSESDRLMRGERIYSEISVNADLAGYLLKNRAVGTFIMDQFQHNSWDQGGLDFSTFTGLDDGSGTKPSGALVARLGGYYISVRRANRVAEAANELMLRNGLRPDPAHTRLYETLVGMWEEIADQSARIVEEFPAEAKDLVHLVSAPTANPGAAR